MSVECAPDSSDEFETEVDLSLDEVVKSLGRAEGCAVPEYACPGHMFEKLSTRDALPIVELG